MKQKKVLRKYKDHRNCLSTQRLYRIYVRIPTVSDLILTDCMGYEKLQFRE
jgi:hypothetical protein